MISSITLDHLIQNSPLFTTVLDKFINIIYNLLVSYCNIIIIGPKYKDILRNKYCFKNNINNNYVIIFAEINKHMSYYCECIGTTKN